MRVKGIIALDLDGTLLTTGKVLTERTERALRSASQAGWAIVPSTGRFHNAMPAELLALPYVLYAITINGAQVYDIAEEKVIFSADMPNAQGIEILRRLNRDDVIYDCYFGNWGYIEKDMAARVAGYNPDPFYWGMVKNFRTHVDDLCSTLREHGSMVQKIQVFTLDMDLRAHLLNTLADEFEDIAVCTSVPCNVEINNIKASKGNALMGLAEHLGVPKENTVAFGDGINDLPMIRMAGIGVAMANAHPDLIAAADEVTLSCDEEGVAARIERLLEETK